MAKTEKAKNRKTRRTRVKVGLEVQTSGRSKGGGTAEIVPTLTIERDRKKRGDRDRNERGRTTRAEHLLDLRLEDVTPAVKQVAAGEPVTLHGAGPRLMVLSPRGVLGWTSSGASEAIRAALAAAPGARLECYVGALDGGAVSVSVRARAEAGRVLPPAPLDVAPGAATGRRGA